MMKALVVTVAGMSLALAAQTGTKPQAPTAMVPAPGTSALTGRIMQRLTDDPALRNIAITASVGENGVVSLNGVVPTQALNDRAVAVVKSTPEVNNVISNIMVSADPFASTSATAQPVAPPPGTAEPAPLPASTAVQAQLAAALADNPAFVRVAAHVYDGEVMVIGTVTKDKEKEQAESIVRKVAPKLTVENMIWVVPNPIAPPPKVPR